jgi:hypothetical protein
MTVKQWDALGDVLADQTTQSKGRIKSFAAELEYLGFTRQGIETLTAKFSDFDTVYHKAMDPSQAEAFYTVAGKIAQGRGENVRLQFQRLAELGISLTPDLEPELQAARRSNRPMDEVLRVLTEHMRTTPEQALAERAKPEGQIEVLQNRLNGEATRIYKILVDDLFGPLATFINTKLGNPDDPGSGLYRFNQFIDKMGTELEPKIEGMITFIDQHWKQISDTIVGTTKFVEEHWKGIVETIVGVKLGVWVAHTSAMIAHTVALFKASGVNIPGLGLLGGAGAPIAGITGIVAAEKAILDPLVKSRPDLYNKEKGIYNWSLIAPEGMSAEDLNKPPGMAEGGVVTSPTMILAGERGREAIVPLGDTDPRLTRAFIDLPDVLKDLEDTLATLTGGAPGGGGPGGGGGAPGGGGGGGGGGMGGYNPATWDTYLESEATKYGISPLLLKAIARQEGVAPGDFNPLGLSPGGGGPTHYGSVEAGSAGIDAFIAKNLSRFRGATGDLDSFAHWYSPIGASNDPNRTNAGEASGIRYWMDRLSSAGGPGTKPGEGIDEDVQWNRVDGMTGQKWGVATFPDGTKIPVTSGGARGRGALPDDVYSMRDYTQQSGITNATQWGNARYVYQLTNSRGVDDLFREHPDRSGKTMGCIGVYDSEGDALLLQNEVMQRMKEKGGLLKVRTHTGPLVNGGDSTPVVNVGDTHVHINGDGHDAAAIGEHVAKAIAVQKMHIQDALAKAMTNLRNHEKRVAFA